LKSISSFLTHTSPKIQKFPSLREIIGEEPEPTANSSTGEDSAEKPAAQKKKVFKKNAVKWKRAFSTKPQYALPVLRSNKRSDWLNNNGVLINSLIDTNRRQRKVIEIVNTALNQGMIIVVIVGYLCSE
jgi:hypothetical protein